MSVIILTANLRIVAVVVYQCVCLCVCFQEWERERHAHSLLQFHFKDMKETLRQTEELLTVG